MKKLFYRDWQHMLRIVMTFLAVAMFSGGEAQAQIRSGNGFLKILPGVRNHGFAGSYTGVIDEMHSLYANPGATGFLREWQWATSYTEWIADTYSLSWLYGRSMPFANPARFAIGVHYQGVREFNSTGNPNAATASASDALFTLSAGVPFGQRNISLGGSVKYFRSDLDGIAASSFIADLGLLAKSERMRLNLLGFDYAIVSAGFSVNQLGNALKFINTETPLPRTFRGGMAINLGTHDGFQLQITGDYNKNRDEVRHFSVGGELSWRYLLGIRAGYNFNDNLISKLTFGFSYRLGNVTPLPGKNNALRLDFAYLEGNDFFSPPLRGGINHYPLRPEKFKLSDSDTKTYGPEDSIALRWKKAHDPDLYDEVNYVLVLTKDDRQALEKLVERTRVDKDFPYELMHIDSTDGGPFMRINVPTNNDDTRQLHHILTAANGHQAGDYYWTVLAYDRDNHARFAESIGHFKVIAPEPVIPEPPVIRYDLMLTQTSTIHPLRPKVHFRFNKAELDDAAKVTLSILGISLQSPELANVFIKLGGHTDQRGSDAYNKALSARRVNAVKAFFEENYQIPPDRIFAHGYGEKYLLADALDYPKEAREPVHTRNRRVEIYMLTRANTDTTNQPIDENDIIKVVQQGRPIHYKLQIVNTGPDTASAFTISGNVPDFAELVAGSFKANMPVVDQSITADSISWKFGTLAPSEQLEITYELVVNKELPANPYKMQHSVAVKAEKDTDLQNNSAYDRVFIVPKFNF